MKNPPARKALRHDFHSLIQRYNIYGPVMRNPENTGQFLAPKVPIKVIFKGDT